MNEPMPGKGAAVGSLVCGIIGLVLSLIFFGGLLGAIGLILGIIGLVLAAAAKGAGFVGGMRTGGFVLSLLAVIFGAVDIVCCIACAGAYSALISSMI